MKILSFFFQKERLDDNRQLDRHLKKDIIDIEHDWTGTIIDKEKVTWTKFMKSSSSGKMLKKYRLTKKVLEKNTLKITFSKNRPSHFLTF